MKTIKIRWFIVAAGIALYLAALAMPSCRSIVRGSDSTFTGLAAFIVGFRFLISWEPTDAWFWILSIAWFANPMISVALIATCCGRWRIAGIAAGCGLVCCLWVLLCFGDMVSGYPGYWAWVGSPAFLLASSLWLGLMGEGSGCSRLKIAKSDDYLRHSNLTGKRFSEHSIDVRDNRQGSFFAETLRHLFIFRRTNTKS